MKRENIRGLLAAIVLATAASYCSAIDALVYKQVSKRVSTDAVGKQHEETLHQTVYASKNALRTETAEISPVTIVRLDERIIYQFDPLKNVYVAMPIEALARDVEKHKEVLKTFYENMSREKKERLAVVLGESRARPKMMDEGRGGVISGYPTRKLAFYENGQLRMELWVTEKFRIETDTAPLLAATGEFSDGLLTLVRAERGVAMRSRVYPVLEIHPYVENEVTEITRKPVADEMFRVPQGLTRVETLEKPAKGSAGAEQGEKAEVPLPETVTPDDSQDAPLPQ